MCGIWLLNPNIFNESDFLPTTVTDQSHLYYNQENITTNNQTTSENNCEVLNIMDMPVKLEHRTSDDTDCAAKNTPYFVVVPLELL